LVIRPTISSISIVIDRVVVSPSLPDLLNGVWGSNRADALFGMLLELLLDGSTSLLALLVSSENGAVV